METGLIYSLIGAALAIFLCGAGSSIGIGYVGREANGVLSEEPEKFGTMLLLVALPGTQGIYGFLTGFLVMMKIGILGGGVSSISSSTGLQILIACLPIAISGFISAIHQGKVCAAGISVASKHPEASMKALVYGALVETYAVLGLVASIFLLMGVKI
ncbi:MAG: V-type ATP synthase subunit K [Candidatus Omnitrophica bacterium]|nr:V-type ATP synthase subunit K [Candidatus Omnitrophota bacterium]MCM8810944.1 V-type ATP synthase subunit K [Candidatus Omnitrophota bacterium]MCM8832545.1 V-type ATP synthase subunit K [Candidatus Omnitrophota bacterium]